MKRLLLQCSTQLSSLHKSSLNIPIWKWSFLLVNLEALICISFCPHHITLYDHCLCVCLIISPFLFTRSLWLGPECDSFLDSSQHLACSLISHYSWIKGQESCRTGPFWEKDEASCKVWPWNKLIGSIWTTRGSGYKK